MVVEHRLQCMLKIAANLGWLLLVPAQTVPTQTKHTQQLLQPTTTNNNHLAHSKGGSGKVDHRALHLGHQRQRIGHTLAANATILEPLEWKVIRATRRCCIDLNGARLHGVTQSNCFVDVLGGEGG